VFLKPVVAEKLREIQEKEREKEGIAEPSAEAKFELKVLLAEDNLVNRILAVKLLEKNGCHVLAVENGLEAIEALEKEDFDLLFMDIQMPVLDGIEATRKIRVRGMRIPIIAMTAHSLDSDRERCFAAGMDDYISKPIDLNILSQKVKYWGEKLMSLKESGTAGVEIAELQEEEKLLDIDGLLSRVGGDEELAKEILALFLDECPEKLASIKSALADNTSEALERSAHALKGTAANVSVNSISELAFKLQKIGEKGDLTGTGAEEIFAELEHKAEAAMAETREYLREEEE